jgi:hypothetical protein
MFAITIKRHGGNGAEIKAFFGLRVDHFLSPPTDSQRCACLASAFVT